MESQFAAVLDINERTFDFIIIGGGTAGCVLANRLSEDMSVSVAVLEAGKARLQDPIINKPMGWSKQFMSAEYDWAFPVSEQANAPTAHFIPWNRGKSLGGSSAMNIMAYTKPSREDLDALEALGNPGWNWASYEKYSKKAEHFHAPGTDVYDRGYQGVHNPESLGSTGPLTLSFVPTCSGGEVALQKSLERHGVSISTDPYAGDVNGTWKGVSTYDPSTGRRVDAATAYLLPALARPNLKVLTEALVHSIGTVTQDGITTAQNVTFQYEDKVYTVKAAKEVILSAGAVKTPQILELSGIGDPAILTPLGIPVVVDLPEVGTNVQEHYLCPGPTFRMTDDSDVVTSNMLANPDQAAALCKLHNVQFDYNLLVNSFTFLPLETVSNRYSTLVAKKKDELMQAADSLSPGLRRQYEIQLGWMENPKQADIELMSSAAVLFPMPEPDKPYLSLVPSIPHPWSRGTIHVASSDPAASPKVDPCYFGDSMDLDILCEGFKLALRLAETEPFKGLVKARHNPPPTMALENDEEIKDFIRKYICTTWHTCGSASMLPRELGGVVDPTLKVYGTSNVRVVDLSILPLHVTVHPQAFVYGIAEKASDIIKASYSH